MKRPLSLALAMLFAASLTGCTITHRFGPYLGRVVDAQTGEPLEGAVVLIHFNTKEYTLGGGPRSSFVDALEVLTDEKGEFTIPAYRAWVFRFPHRWDCYAHITVFKPGYAAYPAYDGIEPIFFPAWSIPKQESVIVRLPKLKTIKDRLSNLGHIPPVGIPYQKMSILIHLIDLERKSLGLK